MHEKAEAARPDYFENINASCMHIEYYMHYPFGGDPNEKTNLLLCCCFSALVLLRLCSNAASSTRIGCAQSASCHDTSGNWAFQGNNGS